MARILIADDNPDVRELLVALFRLHGHEPVAFADGPSLLADLHAQPAALCLLDWMMPGMDGNEVLSRIRSDPDSALAATPVAMLSSIDRSDHRELAHRIGADAYLNKATPLRRILDSLTPFLSP